MLHRLAMFGDIGSSAAFGLELFDQRGAFLAQLAEVDAGIDAGLLCGGRNQRIHFALASQAKGHRVAWLEIGIVPMALVADRGDGRLGRADQLGNLIVADFRMVLDDPQDAIRLVLALRNRRVTRAGGTARLFRLARQLEHIVRIGLAAVELFLGQLAVADRVTPSQLGRGGIIGDGLDFENVQAAEGGDLVEGQRRIVDQPGGGGVLHQRMGGSGHDGLPLATDLRRENGNSRPFSERLSFANVGCARQLGKRAKLNARTVRCCRA